MNYEKDIEIDETALDVEWLEQPSLMLKYARYSAESRRALEEAKQSLDVARAEIDKQIRERPEDFGILKVTEGSIQSAILTEPQYKSAYQAYLDTKYESDMSQGAVRAFEQRKEALENLVKLHGQQYFAGPKVPRDLAWEREERTKRINASITGKLTRRTK